MAWRLARSLSTLRDQVNNLAPGRSKVSDGTVGDAAHASRSSDHNPWVQITENGRKIGIVTGIDFTHDPADGLDSYDLAEALRVANDKRLKYIISNGRISSLEKQGGAWRVYKGKNRHDHHVHISVQPKQALFDDPVRWTINLKPVASAVGTMTPLLHLGSKGDAVKLVQRLLKLVDDGDFGKKTERAVKAFQKAHNLLPDGFVGGKTWRALLDLKP